MANRTITMEAIQEFAALFKCFMSHKCFMFNFFKSTAKTVVTNQKKFL